MLKKTLNRFKGQLAYSFMHQLLMASYGFGLLFVLIRIMPQYEVGRWLLFISALSISDMIMHGLLQTITVKDIASNKDDKNAVLKVFNNAVLLAVSLYFLIAGFGVLANQIVNLFYKPILVLSDFASWYPLLGVFMIIFNLSWWINTGRENFKRIFIQRLIFCCTSILTILIIHLSKVQIDFQAVVFSQVVGFAISSIYAYLANSFSFKFKFLNKTTLKDYLAYGKYTCATMLGSSLLRNADTFMIAAFINPKAVAIYVLAQKVIEIFEVLLRSVASNLFLKLYHLRTDTFKFSQKLIKSTLQITLLFVPAALLIALFSKSVIFVLSGSNDYLVSSEILKIFMIYVILLPADRLLGMALEISNKPQWNMLKTFMLIIVNIAGNFVALYYFHSIIAVAAVSSIALITGIISGLFFLHKFGILKLSRFKKLNPSLYPN